MAAVADVWLLHKINHHEECFLFKQLSTNDLRPVRSFGAFSGAVKIGVEKNWITDTHNISQYSMLLSSIYSYSFISDTVHSLLFTKSRTKVANAEFHIYGCIYIYRYIYSSTMTAWFLWICFFSPTLQGGELVSWSGECIFQVTSYSSKFHYIYISSFSLSRSRGLCCGILNVEIWAGETHRICKKERRKQLQL